MLQFFDDHWLDDSEIGLFWEEASNNADCIFDCSFFVTMEGIAKIGLCAQDAVGTHMLNILGSVVIGNGAA